MVSNDFIADKIEEAIEKMFTEFRSSEIRASEYSIMYDPGKHPYWFILIFFPDMHQLRAGLKSGVCYLIHAFLRNELNKIEEISKIVRDISFESGKRPVEQRDINDLFEKLTTRLEGLQKTAGKADVKICGACGHDFYKHQIMFLNENGKIDATTEGWIMCPEDNCKCFQTWSANFKTTSTSKDGNKANRLKQIFKNLFKRN